MAYGSWKDKSYIPQLAPFLPNTPDKVAVAKQVVNRSEKSPTGQFPNQTNVGAIKYSNGATVGSHDESSIGGCLRDVGSKCLITFSKSAGITDCTSAEILAIVEACLLFRKSPWAKDFRLIIETDSAFTTSWLKNPHRCPTIFKPLIKACLKECHNLDWRVCNSLADNLAKRALSDCSWGLALSWRMLL
ncbi:hypothetical protein GQ457_16G005670 [Hibiscus cannabinus]